MLLSIQDPGACLAMRLALVISFVKSFSAKLGFLMPGLLAIRLALRMTFANVA